MCHVIVQGHPILLQKQMFYDISQTSKNNIKSRNNYQNVLSNGLKMYPIYDIFMHILM